MAAKDFSSASSVVSMADPDSLAAAGALVVNVIDRKGFRWLHITVSTGTNGGTTDMTITVQSSTTSGGTYTDITGAAFTVAATDDNAIFHGVIDLEQADQFIRLAGTAGATAAIEISAIGILTACVNTAEYVDSASGGADELVFQVLDAQA